MKNEVPQQLKSQRLFSIIILILGLTLVTFMITVEGELGALPLFVILVGISWYLYVQYQIKKHIRSNGQLQNK